MDKIRIEPITKEKALQQIQKKPEEVLWIRGSKIKNPISGIDDRTDVFFVLKV